MRYEVLLTYAKVQRMASSDLNAIARDLESWIEHDWIAVINISAEREHLAGPLPPFPVRAPGLCRAQRAGMLSGRGRSRV
jgi:hypothetical protein